MAMVYLLAGLIAFAAIGVPLAYAIGMACVTYMSVATPEFLIMIPQRVWSGAFSYLMVALPLFIFAGELMNESGVTDNIIKFCMYMVRPIRGGLGEVNVVASIIFGGISGSSVADTSALGSVLIPEMEKQGYPPRFAAGITVASSTMGMIVPPSIPMIMFAMISGASIGGLFLAGLIPGVAIGLTQLVVCYIISKKNGYHPKLEPFVWRDFARTMLYGLPAILMPLIIIVSISFGICTASESAAIAVLYTTILGFFLYKRLKPRAMLRALKKTLYSCSSITLIMGFSAIFTWVLTMQKIPDILAAYFIGLDLPRWIMLGSFAILILILGTFIDVTPAILMLSPIMIPVMRSYGVSDYQFGAMLIVGCAIGLVTPPVGMCLNVCTKINKMPIIEIFKGAAPFVACNVLVLLAVCYIPAVSDWLPSIFA